MLNLSWRNILYAILGVILPLAYQELVGKFPTFPLDNNGFVTLILWVIGLIVGGWNVKSIVVNYQTHNKVGKSYTKWLYS